MPLYNYECTVCGVNFDKLQSTEARGSANCSDCGSTCRLVPSMPARVIVRHNTRLEYGTGSPGRYVSSKVTGGLPIYVPSFGAMEQSEVNDVAEAAVAKEQERVAKNRPLSEKNAETKKSLGNVVKIGKSQAEGKRASTMTKVKVEGLR